MMEYSRGRILPGAAAPVPAVIAPPFAFMCCKNRVKPRVGTNRMAEIPGTVKRGFFTGLPGFYGYETWGWSQMRCDQTGKAPGILMP
jgi:hypothetical protein